MKIILFSMTEEIIHSGNNEHESAFHVKMKALDTKELPGSKADTLTKRIHEVWDEILWAIEEISIIPVEPEEIESLARELEAKKNRRNTKTVLHNIGILQPKKKKLGKKSDPDVIAARNSALIRDLLIKNQKEKNIPWYSFHAEWKLIGCIIVLDKKEYIFMDREIVEHPIASWKFIIHMRDMHKQVSKKK